MNLLLKKTACNISSAITVSGSKSETNRLLLLQALYPDITLENVSNSDDSQVMIQSLQSNDAVIDIHHAGTTMRFLTAYFSMQEGREVVLTGSQRMKERPIKILVDALRQIGAAIEYVENEGFPPLRIKGKKLTEHKAVLPAHVSSQYISALLLIAPKLENGLELALEGAITSIPYIKMTLSILNEAGIETSFEGNTITVRPLSFIAAPLSLSVESDWSSASYFYSIAALSEIGTEIKLSSYKQNSLQGDAVLAELYKEFGVETVFVNQSVVLKKTIHTLLSSVSYDLNNAPDIAQTIAVTCFGLGMGCHLKGLHTLKIKETDRLTALQHELTKLGAVISTTNDSLTLEPSEKINRNITISTYQDHRMAMAFAPLALKTDIVIKEAEVVSKSYPDFWNDLKRIGFHISEG
jgi:3-phosphoshikimate 1-carboxyvinyltransferase